MQPRFVCAQNEPGGGRTYLSAFERDPLTGLATRQGFNQAARELIDAYPSERFVVLYGDIDRFKVFNDRYGTEEGDRLLRSIGSSIRQALPAKSVASHLRGDHFVCCLPEHAGNPEHVLGMLDSWLSAYPLDFAFFVRIGMYRVDDPSLDVSLMTDRALLALRSAKSGSERYAMYDDSLRESVVQEQELAGQMADALKAGQFELHFQPQYQHGTNRLVGAEVLARWNHPEKGIIGPSDFIPVFERTGLVSDLDYYIFAEACRCLRTWLDAAGADGACSVPRLSVNVSRKDIYRSDLCEYLVSLVEEHDIPFDLLHLEITESSYMEDPKQLAEAVALLQQAGFVIEMDDFGSGYSSLNALKDVPVDVLKLDLRFLDARNDTRGGVILASVVRMARWLDLPVIAEGVESESQAQFLASVGCDMMQGFLFSKPIDRASFEELMANAEHGRFDSRAARRFNTEASALWDAESLAGFVFAHFAGPAALVEYDGERFEVIRSNDEFHEALDLSADAFARTPDDLFGPLDAIDRESFDEALERAVGEAGAGVSELLVHRSGGEMWIRTSLRRMSSDGVTSTLFVTLSEITEERALRDRLRAAMDGVPGGLAFFRIEEHKAALLDCNDTALELLGTTRERFERLCGIDPLQIAEPSDRPVVADVIGKLRAGARRAECTVRVRHANGELRYLLLSAAFAHCGPTSTYVVIALMDVTEEKERDLRFKRQAERERQLYEAIPCGILRFTVERDPVIVSANRAAWRVFGCASYDEFRELAREGSRSPFGRGGTQALRSAVERLTSGSDPIPFTSSVRRGDGTERWVEGVLALADETEGPGVVQCAFNDVTDAVRERRERAWQNERFRILSELAHAISFDYDSESDTVQLYIDRTGNGMELQVIPSYLKVLGTAGRTEVHPDDVAAVKSMFEQVRAGSSNQIIEYRADYYGTGYRWYRANLFVVGDARSSWHLVGLIDNIQAERDLRLKAECDAVTGLSNHASTRDLVNDALSDSHLAASSVFAVVDLDDFKAVNDTCGHLKGDELLREVASILRANCRETDIVGRVGGDEFVVLLKHINMKAALRVFSVMRHAVEGICLSSPDAPISVSMSVGATQTVADDREYRSVFSRADKALYEAKRAGKNQVRVG